MAYESQVPVRFSDVDPAGIAFYPTLVSYLHVVFEELFEEFVGKPYSVVIMEEKLGFPAVDLQMSYTAPFRFGEKVRVVVTIPRLGRSATTFRYRLFAGDEQRAEAQVTVVSVDLQSLESVPLPDFYRKAFQGLVERDTGAE